MAIMRKILHQAQEEAGMQQVEACKRHKEWKKRWSDNVNNNASNGKADSDSNGKLLSDLFIECLQRDDDVCFFRCDDDGDVSLFDAIDDRMILLENQ